ncbi:MAG: polysaccharide pyruvyl transferase family protein [Planctomycetaceae bacterium]
MTTQFVLAGNGPNSNRGCEAILRGTVEILRRAFGECRFINVYNPQPESSNTPSETDPDIESRPLNRMELSKGLKCNSGFQRFLPYRFRRKFIIRETADVLFRGLESYVLESEAVLSIGGDNYTLDYGQPYTFMAIDEFAKRCHRPLIIWGASIGPFHKDPDFEKLIIPHLKHDVTAIYFREEQSYRYLKTAGLGPNLHRMADPAFVMPPGSVSDEQLGFSLPEQAIGVNLSPMLAGYAFEGDKARWMSSAISIVERIVKDFRLPVILIPHVTTATSDDHVFMKSIYENLTGHHRQLFLAPRSLTASQTKGLISRLRCLVAARTHATIASFSTRVPALSLAYSTKAFGLNERLFGHHDFVVPPEALGPEAVIQGIRLLLQREPEIREQLNRRIPQEIQLAFEAGENLKRVLTSSTTTCNSSTLTT